MVVSTRLECCNLDPEYPSITVIVTGGHTEQRIDGVRKISSIGSGELALKIMEALLRQRGYNIKIIYICGRKAKRPECFGSEKIICEEIESVEDLEAKVRKIMGREKVDYFVSTMAVSDFKTEFTTTRALIEQAMDAISVEEMTPEQIVEECKEIIRNPPKLDNSGKISSREKPIIYLEPTPKVLDLVKLIQERTFLVGFKLLDNESEGSLFEAGFERMIRGPSKCNMVAGNYLDKMKKGPQEVELILSEGSVQKLIGKDAIADIIVETMLMRGQTKHSRSVHQGDYEAPEKVFQEFRRVGKWLFQKGLLPEVPNINRKIGTYGNMSILFKNKVLITGRNVHKGDLKIEGGICKINDVANVDEPGVYANVFYEGNNKASIDSCIHERIYGHKQKHEQGIEAIIHIHTDKLFADIPLTACNYPCGTLEELETIMDVIKANPQQDIIQLYKHGLIVLGKSLENCRDKIKRLFEEDISIELFKKDNSSHEEISKDWERHFDLMNPIVDGHRVYPMKMEYDKNTYIISRGKEDVGILFIEKDKEDLKFVLYTTSSFQHKGLSIGSKMLSILELLAKNVSAQNLMVITKDLCGVVGYYEKQKFERFPDQGEFIVLKRRVQ